MALESGNVQILEIAVICIIIVLQVYVALKTFLKIKHLKGLKLHLIKIKSVYFSKKLLENFSYSELKDNLREDEEEEIDCESVDYHESNSTPEESNALINAHILIHPSPIKETDQIVEEINTYLLKSDRSVINFNVIKDITDRNINVLDKEINQQLPTPLYLGLAATMIGIIFGLWGMDTQDPDNMIGNITILVQGVGTAMIASFIGLSLTTYLSSFAYKNAAFASDKTKNKFFSYLQAVLMPELLNKGETGIDQLNKNLSQFSRIAADSVNKLTGITKASAETVKLQSELMERVDNMNVRKVSKSNLEIFEKLEQNLETFDKFSTYWERLNSSLTSTQQLVNNIAELNKGMGHIEEVAIGIKASLNNYHNTMDFFTKHISFVEDRSVEAQNIVSRVDSVFIDATDALKESISKRMEALNRNSTQLDSQLKLIGEQVTGSLQKATNSHLEQMVSAYNNNVPQFSKLDHLDHLNDISSTLKNHRQIDSKEIVGRLDQLIQLMQKNGSIRSESRTTKSAGNGKQRAKKLWSTLRSFVK